MVVNEVVVFDLTNPETFDFFNTPCFAMVFGNIQLLAIPEGFHYK
jgi:hypothetical protein